MEKLLLSLIILITYSCFSQTKKETEDWLFHNLSERFTMSKDFEKVLTPVEIPEPIYWYPRQRIMYSYRFESNYLLIEKLTYERRPSNSGTTKYPEYKNYSKAIELWVYKIPNIYTVEIEDSADGFIGLRLSFKENSKVSLRCVYNLGESIVYGDFEQKETGWNSLDKFYFTANKVDIEKRLSEIDEKNQGYPYLFLEFYSPLPSDYGILKRIKKAFEHLIAVEGGKVLKEVF
ncbi:MAG TPA: hypothetical protein VKT28_19105 [Puia sp.]|nr:hypothetical protein [Puia sp.]